MVLIEKEAQEASVGQDLPLIIREEQYCSPREFALRLQRFTNFSLLVLSQPFAPIAQGIEHRPPEAGAQVRFLLGARRLLKTGENVRT